MLFGEDRGRPLIEQAWTEDTVKVCLYLFMSLLPQSKKLIKHLANVYSGDKKSAMTYVNSQQKIVIQRTILRELDYAVSDIPITSPELLDLVEKLPGRSRDFGDSNRPHFDRKATPAPAVGGQIQRPLQAQNV